MRIFGATVAIGLVFGLILGSFAVPFMNQTTDTFVVEEKERITLSEGGSKYLIFTDIAVYENIDILLRGKFNSSDLYNEMDVGDTCVAETVGFRVTFLSMYKNILEVECEDAE